MDKVQAFTNEFTKMLAKIRKGDPSPASVEFIKSILQHACGLFRNEATLLDVDSPVYVVGDLHGQVEDLIKILDELQWPPKSSYLFLGDYVDRGDCSIETVLVLFGLKILHPTSIYLLRGNHEFANVNSSYGFRAEIIKRYPKSSEYLYKAFNTVFEYMPLAGLIKQRVFCIHGGISPTMTSMDEIRSIKRPLPSLPQKGLAADLLWSDPSMDVTGFVENKARGISYVFGLDAIDKFCEEMGVDLIIRGHQVFPEGYNRCGKVLSIFGAINYEKEKQNDACVVKVDENLKIDLKIFDHKTKLKGKNNASGGESSSAISITGGMMVQEQNASSSASSSTSTSNDTGTIMVPAKGEPSKPKTKPSPKEPSKKGQSPTNKQDGRHGGAEES